MGNLLLYVPPKALESAWVVARRKGLVLRTEKHGNALVRMQLCSAAGMRVVVDREGRPCHSGSESVSDEDEVDTERLHGFFSRCVLGDA